MFGNLLGDMEERQKEMRENLSTLRVEGSSGDGAVMVTANANREIINIRFDKSKLDWEDAEMVEDLLIAAINEALQAAAEKEAEEAQNLMKDMLPPGFGDLSDLFG
ncbi:MAG TPA: YbaB/EbfC family nucleoid-associated protein [Saprospiraceae bacterium]|nr:YbaB/EbfC family nucleoid-associated protein [Saprospiraceae bacterium]HMQ84748.1 YbaB/EbfC family nucleoid-associated protein [Saprospiraceae bacterium]